MVFEGDTAEVTYDLCADRKDSGQVTFVWALQIANTGDCKTQGLRVGVKAFYRYKQASTSDGLEDDVLDDDDDDDLLMMATTADDSDDEDVRPLTCGKGGGSCGTKDGWSDYIAAGKFEGFQAMHPCLAPGECHAYAITGAFTPKCGVREGGSIVEVKLVTDGMITIENYGRSCRRDGPKDCVTVVANDSGSCKHNDLYMVDELLEVKERISCGDRDGVAHAATALFTPGENVDCGDCVTNVVKIVSNPATASKSSRRPFRKGGKRDRDDCDDECGNEKARSEATLRIGCARAVIKCAAVHDKATSNWCVSNSSIISPCPSGVAAGRYHGSGGSKRRIDYSILAQKVNTKCAKVRLSAEVALEGKVPDYDKKCVLVVYRGNKVIDRAPFTLGACTQLYQYSSKEDISLTESDDDDSCAEDFRFVVKYRRETFDMAEGTLNPSEDTSKHRVEETLSSPSNGDCSVTRICGELCIKPYPSYKIVDVGSFPSREAVENFLRKGSAIRIPAGAKECDLSFGIEVCDEVVSTLTAKLVSKQPAKQPKRIISVEAKVTDDLRSEKPCVKPPTCDEDRCHDKVKPRPPRCEDDCPERPSPPPRPTPPNPTPTPTPRPRPIVPRPRNPDDCDLDIYCGDYDDDDYPHFPDKKKGDKYHPTTDGSTDTSTPFPAPRALTVAAGTAPYVPQRAGRPTTLRYRPTRLNR